MVHHLLSAFPSTRDQRYTDVREAIAVFPRVALARGPTPLEPLPTLSSGPHGPTLHVKRDDLTPFASGGNKVRQVEFILGDAVDSGAGIVLVSGAVQSNFVRVVAAAAARLGMRCEIYLEDRVRDRPDDYYRTGNVLLSQLFGARVEHIPEVHDESDPDRVLEARAEALRAEGMAPYVIEGAVGSRPLGVLGYVEAAVEIMEQARSAGFEPSDVVVASGSGYTQAGLLVGLHAAGETGVAVHGVAVRRPSGPQSERVLACMRGAETLLGLQQLVPVDDVRVTDELLAPGYGILSDEVRRAILLAARQEGLLLDPVYTGRTLAALLRLRERGAFGDGHTVLIHTGGVPALYAYGEELLGS